MSREKASSGETSPAAMGARLRMQRLACGKSQQVVADFCLLRRATLSHYENGRRCPPADVVKRLAEYLGCSADYLLGIEPEAKTKKREDTFAYCGR